MLIASTSTCRNCPLKPAAGGTPAITNVLEGITYGDYYAPPKFPQFVTGDAITLAGASKWRAESIDPVADARVDVAGLTPHCALSVEVVLVGGICQPRLAWYNVTQAITAPEPTDLYEIVPEPLKELSCKDTNGQVNKDGFFLRGAVDEEEAADHLFGLREGTVRDVRAPALPLHARRARLRPQ